ncbi:uncharacterized protein LOC135842174 [Planococcus citri]|uniref:uncharacterized protein LOC135842174 n=1 Tax=Planococcus citri TaxID=170843 RepID=UPI0031F9D846
MINFVVFCWFISVGCVYSDEAWTLQRASGDESNVIFKNTTFTGDLMMCSWSWKDSLDGIWESRVRVSFKNDSYKGGGFDYHDGYGRELIRVRWYQLPEQNITWKSLFTNKFPPTAWNLSAPFATWGFMPTGDLSWSFFVNNVTVEPKPAFQRNKLANPFVASVQDLTLVLRKKRSVQSQAAETFRSSNDVRGFNIIDLFTGNGIFSQVPQMLINVFSFVSSLFPSGSNDYDLPPDDYSTEPDAETVPTTTATAASKTTPAL